MESGERLNNPLLFHPIPELKNPIKDILYGSIAGIVSKAVEHPFDLVKVRLQSQPLDRPFRYTGPVDCFLQTLKGEGIKGLWRGVSMPIGGAMLENATLFLVYNQTQHYLRKIYPPPQTPITESPYMSIPQMLFSAALAGACASFVLTPVELVKCKMQVQNIVQEGLLLNSTSSQSSSSIRSIPISATPKSILPQPGPFTITKSILAAEGYKGLWLGQTGTLIRETGGSAAWFTTFELLTTYFIQRRHLQGQRNVTTGGRITKNDLSAGELMSSGAAAGVVYNCLLFPVDCIKSTIQTEDELRGLSSKKDNKGGNGKGRRSFLKVGKDIYNARGIKGLYQGCGLTALRAAPSSALIFYIYSRLEGIFG